MLNKVIESLVEILNQDAYTNIVVNKVIENTKFNDHEKRLYTKIVYGVVENKLKIDYLLQPLISGKRVKPYIKNALRVGVYGIDFLDLKDYYIVKEVVDQVKRKDFKASSFVNAVLRRYQASKRRSMEGLGQVEKLSIAYSINQDIAKLLLKQYPKNIEDILKTNKQFINTYRINTLKTSILNVEETLKAKKIEYSICDGVILQTEVSLIHTELFKEGCIVAQDKSSIMVGLIANPLEGMKVLDTCSAPGGKTMHLATIMNNKGIIYACDVHPHKIKLIEENAVKQGVTCVKTALQDATKAVYNEEFDLILTDVPCSGLGVIKHKPDIKYHMTYDKIGEIKTLQQSIVENAIRALKRGGFLIYSTCTINKEENEYFIKDFLKRHPNFKVITEIITLPNEFEDGFYICKLKETSDEK